MVAKETSGAGN